MAPISFDDLRRGYLDESMSMTDLARRYNCTRQYIYKLLKYHGIETRDLKASRTLAIKQKKVSVVRMDDTGKVIQVVLGHREMNRSFFKFWSPAMAYVLGVIFTDGNLVPGRERDPTYKTPYSTSIMRYFAKFWDLLLGDFQGSTYENANVGSLNFSTLAKACSNVGWK
jgi:hypothetical protein